MPIACFLKKYLFIFNIYEFVMSMTFPGLEITLLIFTHLFRFSKIVHENCDSYIKIVEGTN